MAKKLYPVKLEYSTYTDTRKQGNPGETNAIVVGIFDDEKAAERYVKDIADGRALLDWDLGFPSTSPDGWSDGGWYVEIGDPLEINQRTEAGTPETTVTGVTQHSLKKLNAHRRSIGLKDLDMADGWTAQEVRNMVRALDETGRLPNPQAARNPAARESLRRKLMS